MTDPNLIYPGKDPDFVFPEEGSDMPASGRIDKTDEWENRQSAAAAQVGRKKVVFQSMLDGSTAVLEAAAQVGEQIPFNHPAYIATIERCAQVADGYAKKLKGSDTRIAEWIRDDILALKAKA